MHRRETRSGQYLSPSNFPLTHKGGLAKAFLSRQKCLKWVRIFLLEGIKRDFSEKLFSFHRRRTLKRYPLSSVILDSFVSDNFLNETTRSNQPQIALFQFWNVNFCRASYWLLSCVAHSFIGFQDGVYTEKISFVRARSPVIDKKELSLIVIKTRVWSHLWLSANPSLTRYFLGNRHYVLIVRNRWHYETLLIRSNNSVLCTRISCRNLLI